MRRAALAAGEGGSGDESPHSKIGVSGVIARPFLRPEEVRTLSRDLETFGRGVWLGQETGHSSVW